MNAVRKSQLSGENMIFKSVITGKFMERDHPTPAILELKLGARVMVLNNKRTPDGKFEYVSDCEKCIGCGICAGLCPCGIWEMEENK